MVYKEAKILYIIVGLGNPGDKYEKTRHNVGFNVIDLLAKEYSIDVSKLKHKALIGEGRVGTEKVILVKPMTYMNLSGKAVNYWMQKEKIAVEDLLVIVDDLAVPFGTLRLKGQGSDGGHNGLKNINALLGTTAYARLRYGIGNDFLKGGQIDYVLGTWNEKEEAELPALLERGGEIITNFVVQGIARTMNIFNTTKK